MKIKLTSVYVDDQEKALRFYTEVLGFVKKADFSQGPFRWLTRSAWWCAEWRVRIIHASQKWPEVGRFSGLR